MQLTCCNAPTTAGGGQDDIRERNQFGCRSAMAVGIAPAPTIIDPRIAPTVQPNSCSPRGAALRPGFRIIKLAVQEHADAPDASPGCAPHRDRPAATPDPCDELPPSHRSSPKLLCGAAYRSPGLMGTGCISPGANLPRPFCNAFVRCCEGFRTPAVTNISTRIAAGVRKPPRDESAGRGGCRAVPRAQLWGFGRGRAAAEVGSAVG